MSEREATMEALVKKWGVTEGQVWEIEGSRKHFAVCADARSERALERICDAPFAGLFTSPPYLGQRDYDSGAGRAEMAREWTSLLCAVATNVLPRHSHEAQVFVNLGLIHKEGRCLRYWEKFLDYVEEELSWPLLAIGVWDKMYPVPGNHYGRFAPQHEWVFHFARKGIGPDKVVPSSNAGKPGKTGRKHAQGEAYGHGDWTAATDVVAQYKIPGSVTAIPVPGGFREKDPGAKMAQLHPARFPIELPAFYMRAYKNLLGLGPWLDPFAGSFTTLLAGEREGVSTRMVEQEPKYFAAALERCQLEGLRVGYLCDIHEARPAGRFAKLFG